MLALPAAQPVWADECSVDRLEVVRLLDLRSASGIDSSATNLVRKLTRLYFDVPALQVLSLTVGSVSFVENAVVIVPDNIYDPMDPIEEAYADAAAQIIEWIRDNLEEPDELIVRINGSTVGSCSTAEPFHEMSQNEVIPFFGDVIQQSFHTALLGLAGFYGRGKAA